MYVMVFLFIFVYFSEIPLNDAHCMDIHHHIVSQGLHYVPGPNPCTLCVCEKGSPKWCKQVLCSPPQNCKSFEVGNSCCEFKCLDDILSKTDYSETYDLALRLIASAVTALLSLSLLFFLIHRLRQRKMRLRQNRQMNEDQRSLNSIGYITGSIGYLPGSIGYLGSGNNEMEFHYDESNVHYPLWKPPGNYFPRGEAPPPYEEAVRAARSEAEMANQLNNAPPFTFSSNRNENVSLTLVHNTHVSITPSVQNTGVASSQCNVMLHQNVPPEPRSTVESVPETVQLQNQANSTSVSLACASGASHDYVIDSSSSFLQNATVESQVDVHYENYNHNTANVAPVVTVSVKNEDFPKQALSVDFLRDRSDRVDRGSYASVEGKNIAPLSSNNELAAQLPHAIIKNDSSALSCSSSWRREAAQLNTTVTKSNVINSNHEIKQKLIEKKQNYKVESITSTPSSSKSYRSDSQLLEPKYKKCNIVMKDGIRSGKSLPVRSYEKQRQQSKCHTGELHKELLMQEQNKHRTIPQKFSKNVGNLDSDICYVNTSEFTRKKDDDFSEHCDLILKQHNIDKIRYAAEKLDKQKSEKTLNASIRNSLCAPVELRNAQRGSINNNGGSIGLRGDMTAHRTLPKNLRELSEAFYFNFDTATCEEVNLECLAKKAAPRSIGMQSETPLSIENKIDKKSTMESVGSQVYITTGTLGRKHALHDNKKSILNSTNNSINASSNLSSNSGNSNISTNSNIVSNTGVLATVSTISPSCYRTSIEPLMMKLPSEKHDYSINDYSHKSKDNYSHKDSYYVKDGYSHKENYSHKDNGLIEPLDVPPPVERDRTCVSYRCTSPVQDDVDDYRSECENCKSLSFEDCNDEEGDMLNETMTLQRRPMEQGEEHSFYRTSLTLPSHTKKAARSVTLNTPRESWFMAMQEMTSSSESD